MGNKVFKLEHTFTLVNVIFGVLIAILLFRVPEEILIVSKSFSVEGFTTITMLISSLLFCFFYWLGMQEFLTSQNKFNKAIGETEDSEISLMQTANFFGGIVMIILIAAILQYSNYATFKAFLITNMLFWVFDFMGSSFVRAHNRKYSTKIQDIKEEFPKEYKWFRTQIISKYPYVYAIANSAFFFIALVLYVYIINENSIFALGFGITLLFLTVLRHTLIRQFFLERKGFF
jgi:hypothetical protein